MYIYRERKREKEEIIINFVFCFQVSRLVI